MLADIEDVLCVDAGRNDGKCFAALGSIPPPA
jgi:hypothetical protein